MTRAPNAPTYSGKPCSKGHDGTRYLSTRACVDCMRERQAARPPRDYSRDARRTRPAAPRVQHETLAPAPARPSMDDGAAMDVQALGAALARSMGEAGRSHVALTLLEGGLWQAVTLRPGYRDQVTRCAADPGEALRLALTGERARSDELLDVVG